MSGGRFAKVGSALGSWLAPPTPALDASTVTRPGGPAHDELRRRLEASIERRGLVGSHAGAVELDALLRERLDRNRRVVTPWLDSFSRLRGARVLEIGCGSGASTVALAERGAVVTAIDVSPGALELAGLRLSAHGLRAELIECNAQHAAGRFDISRFDLVIFYATLEHMTHLERQVAMRDTWANLRPGAHWCVIDTPNRLWWFDSHTSTLPFFQWLPDDVALEYVKHSPRDGLRNGFDGPDALLRLQRAGRSMSYHDVELALGPTSARRVASCLTTYYRDRSLRRRVAAPLSRDGLFEQFLRWAAPDVPTAYLLPYLDFALWKPSA